MQLKHIYSRISLVIKRSVRKDRLSAFQHITFDGRVSTKCTTVQCSKNSFSVKSMRHAICTVFEGYFFSRLAFIQCWNIRTMFEDSFLRIIH